MTVIITDIGRTEPDEDSNVIVKTSGWVKYHKKGEIHHIPPQRVKAIHERDPPEKTDIYGNPNGHPDSNVVYQSPHGRV